MRTLGIDIETYSSVDLGKCGVHKYAASPDFEILLFGYAYDDDPVTVIDLASGEDLPAEIINDLLDPDVLKTAFNAPFEMTCLAAALHRKSLPPDQWEDTAVRARELGLPGSLEAVGAALGLSEAEAKDKAGAALIRFFSKPRKPTKNDPRTRNLPMHDPDRWALYKKYNAQDVVAERAIRKRIERYPIHPREEVLWVIDQGINTRGVLCDVQLAQNAVSMDETIKDRLLAEAQKLTGLQNPKSIPQLKTWIEEQTNVAVDSLGKASIGQVKETATPEVLEMLRLRESLAKTSTEKYSAMLRCADSDGRIRGLTQFYGAGRTGRWAGRLVQLQNLPRNTLPEEELDFAREIVRAGDLEILEMIFDNPTDVLSQLIRTAFIPKPGCRFLVSDFSAIEARVLAWLAGEKWRLDTFTAGGDIYCASASQMFKVPVEKHGVNGHLRQKGKIAELALGYGGSVGALRAMGALEMGLTQEELQPLVTTWRETNPAITKLWWDVDRAVKYTLMKRGDAPKLPHDLTLRMLGSLLQIRLPSGRSLYYLRPQLDEQGKISYEGTMANGGWGRVESYGPKFVENIVQAIARDCLAEAMLNLDFARHSIVFHVHDEVIVEEPEDGATPEDIAALMTRPIDWAPGLPLDADAYACTYYKKD